MKLVYIIVSHNDSAVLQAELVRSGFFATKLASTGGFLRAGNATFMICAESQRVDEIIEIAKKNCKRRSEVVASSNGLDGMNYDSVPVEITVGGATIFTVDVDRFEKI